MMVHLFFPRYRRPYSWHKSLSLSREEEGGFMVTKSAGSTYCVHTKCSGGDIKPTHIYTTTDGKYVMGAHSHESLAECIDKRRMTHTGLRPIKRPMQSFISGPKRMYGCQERIEAQCRIGTAREWKSDWRGVKLSFDGDHTMVVGFGDKKSDKIDRISLRDCRVYEVDRALFGLPHCLQVVQGNGQSHYLSLNDSSSYMEVLDRMNRREHQQPIDNGPRPPGKRVRNLRVKVCKVDSPVNLAGPVYCSIGFDGSVVQRTPDARCGRSEPIVWNSTLQCRNSNLAESNQLRVRVCYGKGRKPCEVEAASIPLGDMQSMKCWTDYFTLNLKGQNSNVKPKLKLELYYRDHAVLDVHHYHSLVKELQRDGFELLKMIRTLDWETRREIVAGVLLTIYDENKLHMLKQLMSAEIASHPLNDPNSVLRDNSLTTALILSLLQSAQCASHLEHVICSIVQAVEQRPKVCSGDQSPECATKANKSLALGILVQSVALMPPLMRAVLGHLLKEISSRWPDHPNLQTIVLQNIMMVRLYIPRLYNPSEYGLTEVTNGDALKSVAKAIRAADLGPYLKEFRKYEATPTLEEPQLTNLQNIDATEGAHLAHLVMESLTPGLPGLSTLDTIVNQLTSIELTVNG